MSVYITTQLASRGSACYVRLEKRLDSRVRLGSIMAERLSENSMSWQHKKNNTALLVQVHASVEFQFHILLLVWEQIFFFLTVQEQDNRTQERTRKDSGKIIRTEKDLKSKI